MKSSFKENNQVHIHDFDSNKGFKPDGYDRVERKRYIHKTT